MSPKASPLGDITAKEFARLRKRMGLSQEQLSRALGVSAYTVSRYETGARPIPRKIELALRYLLSKKGVKRG
jgi:transcriptional regulator with XRE-family HTH domain